MSSRKTVFIIPGYKQRPENKAYREIAKFLKLQGYTPVLISIPWKKTTISKNVEYFLSEYKSTKASKKYILGFSYGAMIAFIAATKVSTSGLILCSLSPYFAEDLPKRRKITSALMRQRYEDFSGLNCAELSKKVKAKKILMLYGQEEASTLVKRVTDTFGQVKSPKKYLITVAKSDHEIGNSNYLHSIHYATQNLL